MLAIKTKTPTKQKNTATARQKRTRQRKVTQSYKSFKLSKKLKHPERLPASWKIFRSALALVRQHKKTLIGVFAILFILSLIFVRGLGGGEVANMRELLDELFDVGFGRFFGGVAILGLLATDVTAAPNELAGLYQTILFLLVTLASIYVFRVARTGKSVGIREAFYKGMYPLIPFLLVLFVIGLQLIPLAIGAWLFGTVTATGLAVTLAETVLWGILFFLLALLSLYMITSSIFAMYIVTLPDMYPLQALRSARELVRFRRWTVMRKVLFLPLALIIIGIILLLPIAMFLTPVAEFAVMAYSLAVILFAHAYMYTLYRELL
jgi:hypothetical protein